MFMRFAKAVLILPGTALVYMPLLLHWFTGDWPFGGQLAPAPLLLLALVISVPAALLAAKTMRLFATQGDGTPAPWDPPQNFVVAGPYQYVRNPMLTAACILIVAEAIAFQSTALWIWAAVFICLNTVYFVFSEEPALERRFGAPYTAYKTRVRRWVPRLTPYQTD